MKEEMNLSDLWGGCIWSRGKQQTNADRIRAKSDEELAEKISAYMTCMDCLLYKECKRLGGRQGCKSVWLDWLKSPVEEGDNGT